MRQLIRDGVLATLLVLNLLTLLLLYDTTERVMSALGRVGMQTNVICFDRPSWKQCVEEKQ